MSSNIEVKLDVLNQLATPAMYAAALANRPAAGFVGRIFFDSDNPSTGIYRDTGTTWVQVADETGTIPTPTLQTVTTAGNTSNVGISITANGIGIGTTIPASNRLDIHTATGINATFNGTGTTNSALQLQSAGVGKWTIQNNYNSAANDFVLTDVASSVNRLTITNTGVGTLTASLSATKTATYSSGGAYGIYGNDNYTIPAATSFGSGGLIFASLQGVQNFTYGGNATYDNSALNGSVVGINQIQFSSTGTITMNQATGVRAMTAGIFQNQFLGATNGTITHLAGIEVLGVYKASTGIATITNAYGLLINNIDDYTSGFSFTNRWGIYQAGASDNNYFAGKVILGSTTVGIYQLDVTGQTIFRSQVNVGNYIVITDGTYSLRRDYLNSYDNFRLYTIVNQSPLYLGSGTINTCAVVNGVGAQRGLIVSDDATTLTIVNTAALQINSTLRGFLPPRMTTAQKNAIATPATGLVVYDTTLNKLALYTGAGWETVTSI